MKKMRKILVVLVALCMLFGMANLASLSASASGESEEVGTVDNPEVLESLEVFRWSAMGVSAGYSYCYSYTATEAGDLVVFANEGDPTGAEITLIKGETEVKLTESTYVYNFVHPMTGRSNECPAVKIPVAVGETVKIKCTAESDVMYCGFLATITTASSGGGEQAEEGTEGNPIVVGSTAEEYIVPAGETYYFAAEPNTYATVVGSVPVKLTALYVYDEETDGSKVYVSEDGTITDAFLGASKNYMDEYTIFTITNEENEDASYIISANFEVGSYDNPHKILEMKEYSVVFEPYAGDYHFSFVATEAGEVTFTMLSDAWTYSVDKIVIVDEDETETTYGSIYKSGLNAESNSSITIEVEAGDTLILYLNGCEYWEFDEPAEDGTEGMFCPYFMTESGEVAFAVSFVDAETLAEIADVVADVEAAEKGETVVVEVQEDGTIAADILEAAKENEVVIKVETPTYTWVIDGATIGDDIAAVNLEVEIGGTSVVPANVLSTVEKENYVALSLAHDGAFGFDATLSFKIDAKYAGKEAALYYYNTTTGKLELQGKVVVGKNGEVAYDFDHASDYIIAINEVEDVKSPETGDYNMLVMYGMFILAGGLFVLRKKVR